MDYQKAITAVNGDLLNMIFNFTLKKHQNEFSYQYLREQLPYSHYLLMQSLLFLQQLNIVKKTNINSEELDNLNDEKDRINISQIEKEKKRGRKKKEVESQSHMELKDSEIFKFTNLKLSKSQLDCLMLAGVDLTHLNILKGW